MRLRAETGCKLCSLSCSHECALTHAVVRVHYRQRYYAQRPLIFILAPTDADCTETGGICPGKVKLLNVHNRAFKRINKKRYGVSEAES